MLFSIKKGTVISWLLTALMPILSLYSFYKNDYLWGFACAMAFLLSITPIILRRQYGLALPPEINFLIVLALFLHVGGGALGLYRIQGWDYITHFLSSGVIAILGFMAVVILDQYSTSIEMNRWMVGFFVVVFAIAMGALWEMGEYICDFIFGTTEQAGLDDSMVDLMIDSLAGLIVGIIGAIYLKFAPKERFVDDLNVEDMIEKIKILKGN
jgi:uncharacterized membrane protein YjdF